MSHIPIHHMEDTRREKPTTGGLHNIKALLPRLEECMNKGELTYHMQDETGNIVERSISEIIGKLKAACQVADITDDSVKAILKKLPKLSDQFHETLMARGEKEKNALKRVNTDSAARKELREIQPVSLFTQLSENITDSANPKNRSPFKFWISTPKGIMEVTTLQAIRYAQETGRLTADQATVLEKACKSRMWSAAQDKKHPFSGNDLNRHLNAPPINFEPQTIKKRGHYGALAEHLNDRWHDYENWRDELEEIFRASTGGRISSAQAVDLAYNYIARLRADHKLGDNFILAQLKTLEHYGLLSPADRETLIASAYLRDEFADVDDWPNFAYTDQPTSAFDDWPIPEAGAPTEPAAAPAPIANAPAIHITHTTNSVQMNTPSPEESTAPESPDHAPAPVTAPAEPTTAPIPAPSPAPEAPSPVTALTNEQLENPELITSLTPEQATQLLAAFKGKYLLLNGLTTLDVATAEKLATFKGNYLSLDGLTTMDTETAEKLSNFKGKVLSLKGLTTLDAEAAKNLKQYKLKGGKIYYTDNIRALLDSQAPEPAAQTPAPAPAEPQASEALAPSPVIDLTQEQLKRPELITHLTPEQATQLLANFRGDAVWLDGLTTLDTATAEKLATFRGVCLGLNGLTTLNVATAEKLATFKGERLHLNGLTALDVATAEKLANFKGKGLYLCGLTNLNAATTEKLTAFGGQDLVFNGLTTMDAATAEKLATFKGNRLGLAGLTTIDADTAKKLTAFKGSNLELEGLTTLNADTAEKLAAFKAKALNLYGLTTLDADTAEKLATFKGQSLWLKGLTTLDADTAEKLANFKGEELYLSGLTNLNAATAEKLATFKGKYLCLNRLTTLDADTAEKLATCKARALNLDGLTTLDSEAAQNLKQYDLKGGLIYCPDNIRALLANQTHKPAAQTPAPAPAEPAPAPAPEISSPVLDLTAEQLEHPELITSLTPEQATQLLATFKKKYLILDGLTTLDANTAEKLANFNGTYLRFNGLTTLDTEAAKNLKQYELKGGAIYCPDNIRALLDSQTPEAPSPVLALTAKQLQHPESITSLTPEQATQLLANFRGEAIWLDGLTTLDATTAEKLAAFKGKSLVLDRLTTLDADTAEKLATFKGQVLRLSGLTALDATTAEKLAAFKGQVLGLNGLTTLDAETAEKLAAFKGQRLDLDGLTTIDADTAEKLAAFKGQTLHLKELTPLSIEAAKNLKLYRLNGGIIYCTANIYALLESQTPEAPAPSPVLALTNQQLANPELITSLTPEQATQLLAAFKGKRLDLNGLKTLDAATAEKLAAFKGKVLSLRGLTALDAATAEKLAAFKEGYLILDGLTTLDVATAEKLATLKGQSLWLNGLTTFDAETAEKIAAFKGEALGLDRLTTLDADTAEKLATFKGERLYLKGLTTLNTEAAKNLKQYELRGGTIDCAANIRTFLDSQTPEAPGPSPVVAPRKPAPVWAPAEPAPATAPPPRAEHPEKAPRQDVAIIRQGVSTRVALILVMAAAGITAGTTHYLTRNSQSGGTNAPAPVSAPLSPAPPPKPKVASRVINLTAEQSEHPELITSLTPEQATQLLATFEEHRLELNGLTALNAATAERLATFKGGLISLNGLTSLDPATAEKLATSQSGLYLDNVTTISADTAKKFITFKGEFISIFGLQAPSAATVEALRQYELNGGSISCSDHTRKLLGEPGKRKAASPVMASAKPTHVGVAVPASPAPAPKPAPAEAPQTEGPKRVPITITNSPFGPQLNEAETIRTWEGQGWTVSRFMMRGRKGFLLKKDGVKTTVLVGPIAPGATDIETTQL